MSARETEDDEFWKGWVFDSTARLVITVSNPRMEDSDGED